jgi:hypothetical protein
MIVTNYGAVEIAGNLVVNGTYWQADISSLPANM